MHNIVDDMTSSMNSNIGRNKTYLGNSLAENPSTCSISRVNSLFSSCGSVVRMFCKDRTLKEMEFMKHDGMALLRICLPVDTH